MKITRKTVSVSECDSNMPIGECLAGPFEDESETKAHAADNYTCGDLYVVMDDMTNSGYYLYDFDSDHQAPAFVTETMS